MFIPEVKVSMIDPETNAGFIQNYLSKEKAENTTRPFYDKTILLYPELKNIHTVDDEKARKTIIQQAVFERLWNHRPEIEIRIQHFQDVFDSFIRDFIEAECKLFHYEWKASHPQIDCFVGYLPFYPRSTEEKCFYVSYQDEERVFSGAVHEINHMIFFEKWKEIHGIHCPEPQWPDPLWYLEEIIVDPTLNDERVKCHTLYENKAYPMFYEKDSVTGVSIMDQVMACYKSHSKIEDFLNASYKIMREHFDTAR
ncbi:MAG: hypothetical protein IKZ98_12060 [Clostridia bacterium]|nr:hypothetical protein [Clostridia bacterium]